MYRVVIEMHRVVLEIHRVVLRIHRVVLKTLLLQVALESITAVLKNIKNIVQRCT